MPLFRRGEAPAPVPFRCTLSTAFTVPLRGIAVVCTVTAGSVVVGQPARLLLPAGPLPVTVERIEVRRRRSVRADTGDEAALYLSGLAMPTRPGSGGTVADPESLAGVELVAP
ncbi:hypothetical protein [Actinocatenispora rupis]|uniref:Uncharacterized protein n=1 Tax=Actinocatenispora rupis TaxID=519421 RepID=A0A8J3IXY7_9ACTN|nr:hypothetical protein [Actinocatenispora rupis]GID10815.1 hypothetical protein Aru02nite_17040 [Actinocatenispora rupis]